MDLIKDFKWKEKINVYDFVNQLGSTGFQSIELKNASDLIVKIKKNNARTYLIWLLLD